MPRFRSRRLAALVSVTALGTTAFAATPAQAQLGNLLPDLGGLTTNTGQTLGNLVPGVGGVVTGVTGTVGGVVGGVQDTVTGVVDQTLGGVVGGGGGLLPGGVLDSLLGALLGPAGAPGGAGGDGFSGIGGPLVLSGGSIGPGGVIVDASAPRPKVKVLSKLRSIGRTGKMRLQVSTNEPGIVALGGNVRPGKAVKSSKRKARSSARHSRKLVKVPSVVLGYRRAGKLTLTVKLSRAAQRTLGRARDARISVGTLAADVFRNQDSDHTKLKIKR